MGFFEIIGFAACIVGAAVLVAWIITFFDEWNDIQYKVREGIPDQYEVLFDRQRNLEESIIKLKKDISKETEEAKNPEVTYATYPPQNGVDMTDEECNLENEVTSLCERITILEQYVKLLCENNNIIPMSIPYQADLEKDVVKTSIYPQKENNVL